MRQIPNNTNYMKLYQPPQRLRARRSAFSHPSSGPVFLFFLGLGRREATGVFMNGLEAPRATSIAMASWLLVATAATEEP